MTLFPFFLELDWVVGGLLAALSVGGLLIGFLLLYVRFARIEELLSRLQEIQTLTEEIRALRESLAGLTVAEVEAHLEEIGRTSRRSVAVLESLHAGVERIEENLGRRRSGSIRDLVERKFFNQGYSEVSVLTDLDDLDEEPYRLQVEAIRGGITYKGTVVIQHDSVVEATLKPSYEVFP